MTKLIFNFNSKVKKIKTPKNILGGKGANLSEMGKMGLPVPPGFTISTNVCELFYKNNRKIDFKIINQIKFELSDLASRSKNCLYAEIENPDDELLFAIILKNFSDRQIKIEKKIINFIISRIDRSYRKIDEFIYKIDELSLKKKKPINLKTIKEIL